MTCTRDTIQYSAQSASAIPGNIGVVGARVAVWDHDPFQARPRQTLSFPMSSVTGNRIDESLSSNVIFEAGGVLLQPVFSYESMPVAAKVSTESGFDRVVSNLPDAGRMQNLWIHTGSLFEDRVYKKASDYNTPDAELAVREGTTVNVIRSQPVWDYNNVSSGEKSFIIPIMKSKQQPLAQMPVHWTLERYQPVWQGADFWIDIDSINKMPDEGLDPNIEEPLPEVATKNPAYQYLEAYPYNPGTMWQQGVKNGAYSEDKNATESKRTGFWRNNWKYKSYILVEIGVNSSSVDHPNHYFIEMVSGGQPRLISVENAYNPTVGYEIKYSRQLSVYPISVNDLLSKGKIRFLVRNHLGKIIISFQDHLDLPWVVTKPNLDPKTQNDNPVLPMVVPQDTIRIHGGNFSCNVNFAIAKYKSIGYVEFKDEHAIQADTFNSTDKDLYILFSHLGNTSNNTSKAVLEKFSDPRLGCFNGNGVKIGYDCDSYMTYEILKNESAQSSLYDDFPEQFKLYGRGFSGGVLDQVAWDNSIGIIIPDGQESWAPTRPSIISISPLPDTETKFKFGLTEQEAPSYPYRDYVSEWSLLISLHAGSISDGTIENDGNKIFYERAVTPIITCFTVHVLGGEKPFKDKVEPLDISPLVMKMTDSWKSEDWHYINHEMQISCYLPMGEPISGGEEISSLAKSLYALHDKMFYISVAYWWDYGIGKRSVPKINIKTDLADTDALLQMVGLVCHSKFELANNKLLMNLTVKDYSWILDKVPIYNSPFFDAVSDITALYELAKLAGLDDDIKPDYGSFAQDRLINRKPLGYLQTVQRNPGSPSGRFYYNGEECNTRPYALPGSYASLMQTSSATRAQNGESTLSFMKKLAQFGPKCLYFDRYGVLKAENLPSIDSAFSAVQTDNTGQQSTFNTNFTPKIKFFTSPFENGFDPDQNAAQLVYDTVSYERSVEDCFNHLTIVSASPELKKDKKGDPVGGLIVEGYTFFEQIWDPTSEGFIGFRKPFIQENGVFGGRPEVLRTMQHYAKMKYPITIISFQTYGMPGLKPLDVISLDGNSFYITEISHEIDLQTNRWWMNVTGEWLKPFTGTLGQIEATTQPILPS